MPHQKHPTQPAPLQGTVDVYVDKTGHLGPLSYIVPSHLRIHHGTEVTVPFGKSTRQGIVLGPSKNPEKATREIIESPYPRATPQDLHFAHNIAKHHFTDPLNVIKRLAPTNPKTRNQPPLPTQPPTPVTPTIPIHGLKPNENRRLIIRAPLIDEAALAAQEAHRLSTQNPDGQILIICPTITTVTAVMKHLPTGAARLDTRAPEGAWKALTQGTLPIAVGTRTAVLYSAPNLAGIIIVGEDHPGHQESSQPYTHARDLANARTKTTRTALTLITAHPTPAALGANLQIGHAGTRTDWPRMRLIDRGEVDPVTRWIPTELTKALAAATKTKKIPWILAPRKTATRRCARCHTPRPCTQCTSSLCTHQDTTPCPTCNTTDSARVTGWDKERLNQAFNNPNRQNNTKPRAKIVDTAELPRGKNVGLVVIFDIDAHLRAPDLLPESYAATLITQAATAAGPNGTVLALTANPTQPTIHALFAPRDVLAVSQRALEAARRGNLPPFQRLIKISSGQEQPPQLTGWPGTIHGPAKKGDNWEALITIPTPDLLTLAPHVRRLRRAGKIRITVT